MALAVNGARCDEFWERDEDGVKRGEWGSAYANGGTGFGRCTSGVPVGDICSLSALTGDQALSTTGLTCTDGSTDINNCRVARYIYLDVYVRVQCVPPPPPPPPPPLPAHATAWHFTDIATRGLLRAGENTLEVRRACSRLPCAGSCVRARPRPHVGATRTHNAVSA